jgi:hypothetical protein
MRRPLSLRQVEAFKAVIEHLGGADHHGSISDLAQAARRQRKQWREALGDQDLSALWTHQGARSPRLRLRCAKSISTFFRSRAECANALVPFSAFTCWRSFSNRWRVTMRFAPPHHRTISRSLKTKTRESPNKPHRNQSFFNGIQELCIKLLLLRF